MSYRYGPDSQDQGFISDSSRGQSLYSTSMGRTDFFPTQTTRNEYMTAPSPGSSSGFINAPSIGTGYPTGSAPLSSYMSPSAAGSGFSSTSSSIQPFLAAPSAGPEYSNTALNYYGYSSGPPRDSGALDPRACKLHVQQQPREACLAVKDKEKMRKPIDPPPMVQLTVDTATDPHQQFHQNPHLFVCATLYKGDQDEAHGDSRALTGTLTSSLHRLKGLTNKDGAWFVFSDISVMVAGSFRLCFTLYEFVPGELQVRHLGSQISGKFDVVLPKDFRGLEESTLLTRSFAEQGVRLRLRKEARGLMAGKRRSSADQGPTSITPIRPAPEQHQIKRVKHELPPPTGSSSTLSNACVYQTAHQILTSSAPGSQLGSRVPYALGEGYVDNTPSTPLAMYSSSVGSYTNAQSPYTPSYSTFPGSLLSAQFTARGLSTPSLDDAVYSHQQFHSISGTNVPYTG